MMYRDIKARADGPMDRRIHLLINRDARMQLKSIDAINYLGRGYKRKREKSSFVD